MASTGTDTAATGASLHPDLEKIASRQAHSTVPHDELLAGEADAELLGMSKRSIDIRSAPNLVHQPSSDTNKNSAAISQ